VLMANHMRAAERERLLYMPGLALLAVDSAAWAVGVLAAMALRFDFEFTAWSAWSPVTAIVITVVAQVAAGTLSGLYAGRWRRGSLDEGLALARAVLVSCAVMLIANDIVLDARVVPTSVVLAAAPAAFCGAGAARFLERLAVLRRGRRAPSGAAPVLIFGAGDGGSRCNRTGKAAMRRSG
jgi:FlaA1/EpsC-like NDP-sugar epimerase